MHIAYLFDRPLPAKETDSEQVMNTVAALARRGVQVTLILPQPQAHKSAPLQAAQALRDYYQVQGDFAVRELPNSLGFWSTARKWQHAARAIAHAQTLKADVLYTRNFPTLFRLAGQGAPYAYETYRPWADQFPMLRSRFRAALQRPNCLGAILHSEFARSRYLAWGIPHERLSVVLNGYEPQHFAERPGRDVARARLALPIDRKIVVYTGHINATKGIDVVLAMAKRCPEADFLLVGSEKTGLIELLARPYKNVTLVPWQPFDRATQYLFAADVLLLPPSRVPLRVIGNTVLPMKLFLYLAAGRPILAPNTPDTRELLRAEPAEGAPANAVLVPAGDVESASQALKGLLGDAALAAALAQGALQTAAGLTWDARAEKIEAFLQARLTMTHAHA